MEFTAELTVIKNHKESVKYKAKVKDKNSTKKSVVDKFFNIDSPLELLTKEAEIKICAFLSAHNISFLSIEHLIEILKSSFKDSKIAQNMQLKRTKATTIVTNVIGEYEKDNLVEYLKSAKFSVLVDETTDISTNKMICIIVRYYNSNVERIVSSFYELLEVHKISSASTAKNLFNMVISAFENQNIPLDNIIGFGSDGCNTMMGEYNSVASRFKEQCPGIIIMKCICHSFHLCASEACKKLPRTCEDLARNIYNSFKVRTYIFYSLYI